MDSTAFAGVWQVIMVGCVPLGLWKLVEICIWLVRHVNIGIN